MGKLTAPGKGGMSPPAKVQKVGQKRPQGKRTSRSSSVASNSEADSEVEMLVKEPVGEMKELMVKVKKLGGVEESVAKVGVVEPQGGEKKVEDEEDGVATLRAITTALQRKLAECGLSAEQMVEVLEIAGRYSDVVTRMMLCGVLPAQGAGVVRSRSRSGRRPAGVRGGGQPQPQPQPVPKVHQRPQPVPKSKSKPQKGTTYAVIVKGGEGIAPEAVQKQLLEELGGKVDVRVKDIRPVSSGVRVVTCSSAEVEKIKASEAVKTAGLRVEDPVAPLPRVMLMDVPQSMVIGELMQQVYDKNVGPEMMTPAAFEKAVRLVNRPNSGELTGHVVLEVPERLAEAWSKQRRLYVCWQSYRVRVLENQLGCYKCYGIGHRSYECKVPRPLCKKCGGEGHQKAVCPNVESCRNCRLLGRPSNHSVTSVADCPVYARACGRKIPV